ncbi:hypothetical protein AMAG_15318 [Allomyces macrogynus ATCC 38327]|uniref:Uncharacterized protein n=1 Tax=Allomyces macrogynus (strain ATCC 38327) TaxID=578462 RepID=A0A0L0T8C4_ALLM3|nr:hypothetical protein AMAG_15318 [Allomyces macrogynus ATCC 38327]|eukprot:KNE71063.1 hypothetical protein AMAG_15318 [Allomyces macrogynus ATCC 38327]
MSMCRFLQQVLRTNASDQGLGTVVQNAYANMMKSMALGARQLGPSDDEVVALMTQSNLRLKVELPDQVGKTFLIDSYTIAAEILVKLEERFEMDGARHEYGLAIDAGVRPSTMPLIPVMPSDRLADIITLAERLREKLSAAAGSDAPGGAGTAAIEGRVAPRIVYIRRQWTSAGSVTSRPHRNVKEGEAAPGDSSINSIPSLPKNLPPICAPALLDWTFQQLVTRFLVGDIISAAELKPNVLSELVYLMALLGVVTAVSDVQHLIPPVVLANLDTSVMVFRSKIQIMMEDWVESHKPSVVVALGTTGGNDPGAITKALVNLAKKEFNERMRATFQYFGAFPFKIKSSSDARFANGAVLIVHESSIVILDDRTRKVIMTIEYDELVNELEFGQDEFVIRTESMVQRRNVRFETVQGFMLADMITAAKDRVLASKKTKPAAAPTTAPATARRRARWPKHRTHHPHPRRPCQMQVPMAVPMMQAPMMVPAMAAVPPKPFPDMCMYSGHPQYSQAPQQAYGYYGQGGAPAPMMGAYGAPGAPPMGYPGAGYGAVQGMPMQGQPPMPAPGPQQGYNQYYYPPGPGQ